METSYVLVKSEMAHEMEVTKELLALDLVKEARGTFVVYDIFVKIEANTYEQIENAITKQIRKIPLFYPLSPYL